MILRLILGDQLNSRHSWYEQVSSDILYVMMEVRQETDYARHHVQKVLGFFAAMRSFSQHLQTNGHRVRYISLNDPANTHSIPENILKIIESENISRFEYQLPDEYRLDVQMHDFCQTLPIPWAAVGTEHFLTERNFLGQFFKGKKTYLMETFYRHIRQRYGLLMEGKQPAGGKWNFDADNRKPYDGAVPVPPPLTFGHDLRELHQMIQAAGVQTIGTVDAQRFGWPINREESLQLLDFFLHQQFAHFGTYEDALDSRHPVLFHSRLSFALNTKMLSPLEVVKAAEAHYYNNPERISLPQVEGFIRQIIGWREYMRGVYWAHMPEYASRNFFGHDRPLPEFYWSGQTKMACLKDAIGNSLKNGYAHHIQRLMVTGNFALLAGIHPDAVDAWYLGIYVDALDWVEITNTRGMSQFADGGLVGTKPYVSSAAYIDRMGNYCKGCHYDKKAKYGQNACPFNSLYWHFYDRHTDKLARNPRIGMMYRTWEKMNPEEKGKILQQAAVYLEQLDHL